MKVVYDVDDELVPCRPENEAYLVRVFYSNGKPNEAKFFEDYSKALMYYYNRIKTIKKDYSNEKLKRDVNCINLYGYKGTLPPLFFEFLNDLDRYGDDGMPDKKQRELMDMVASIFSTKMLVLDCKHLTDWEYEKLEVFAGALIDYITVEYNQTTKGLAPVYVDVLYRSAQKENPKLHLELNDFLHYQECFLDGLNQVVVGGKYANKMVNTFVDYCQNLVHYMSGAKEEEPLLLLTEEEWYRLEKYEEYLKKKAQN